MCFQLCITRDFPANDRAVMCPKLDGAGNLLGGNLTIVRGSVETDVGIAIIIMSLGLSQTKVYENAILLYGGHFENG